MTVAQMKQTISALASHLKANPELMESELEQLKRVMPQVSEAKMKALVGKLASPDFDAQKASKDFESLIGG